MAPKTNSPPSSDDIDALFQLPLAEFTSARNALAARLKKEGHKAAAARVRDVQKPSVSAWAVNQLHWAYRRDFARLLDAGDRFRDAQQARIAGRKADVRGTLDARRKALTAMATRAADLLRAAGHAVTPGLMRRVATTLETLATYGARSAAPAAGRLVDDVEPAGFEALATLIPSGEKTGHEGDPPRIIPFRRKVTTVKGARPRDAAAAARARTAEEAVRRAAARRGLQDAEKALRGAKTAARRASLALRKAAPRAKAAERLRVAAEKRFEKAARTADDMTREARRVARAAEEAAQAVTDAEAAVARARERLKNGLAK